MPTGYTAAIADGITFKQYAMICARAFGALAVMRDEPPSAEIPQAFEPSLYHMDKIEESKTRIRTLEAMDDEEADRLADHEWKKAEASRLESIARATELRRKYDAMLKAVDGYVPPSHAHVGLKDFMAQQIKGSIPLDCSLDYYQTPAPKLSGSEWLEQGIAKAYSDVVDHQKEYQNEVTRTNQRNEWLRLLRDSLGE